MTPYAVLAAAALVVLSLRAPRGAIALALVSGVAYANGHGIHLAANSIGALRQPHDAARLTDFWDEHVGHIEWHLGWLGVMAAFVLADRGRERFRPLAGLPAAAMLGAALCAYTIEGQTWWMLPPAAVLAVAGAVWRRSHVASVCALALVLGVLCLAGWALYWDGVPQITDVSLGAGPTSI